MSEHVDTIPKRASVDLGFPRSVIFGAAGLGAALLGNYVATTWVGNIVRNYIGAGWDIVALTVAVLLVVMAVLVPVLLALGVGKDLVPEKPVVGAVLAAAVPLASLVVVLCFLLFGMIPVVPLLLMDLLPASWLNGQGGLQYETWQLWAAPFALLLVLTGIEEATNYLRPRQATIFHLVLTVGLAALISFIWWTEYVAPWVGKAPSEAASSFRALVAAVFIGLAGVAWNRQSVRAIAGNYTSINFILSFGLFLSITYCALWTLSILRFGLRSPAVVDGSWVNVIAAGVVPFVVLRLLQRKFGTATVSSSGNAVGVVREATRNGFPSLAWAQEVGTGRTVGQGADRAERYLMLGLTAAGVVVGYYMKGVEGAVIGGFIAGLFASLMPRDAAVPDLRLPIEGSGAAAPRAPRPLTDQERRALAAAETRVEDCEVFIEEAGDELFFCVARGNKSTGPLPVVERVPWSNEATTFDNFEEGSHRHWFRSKSAPDDLPDWDVIIAQARLPRVVKVAESVNDHASMVELLTRLQKAFTEPKRHELVTAWKLTKEEAKRAASGSMPSHAPDAAPQGVAGGVPVKPF